MNFAHQIYNFLIKFLITEIVIPVFALISFIIIHLIFLYLYHFKNHIIVFGYETLNSFYFFLYIINEIIFFFYKHKYTYYKRTKIIC